MNELMMHAIANVGAWGKSAWLIIDFTKCMQSIQTGGNCSQDRSRVHELPICPAPELTYRMEFQNGTTTSTTL